VGVSALTKYCLRYQSASHGAREIEIKRTTDAKEAKIEVQGRKRSTPLRMTRNARRGINRPQPKMKKSSNDRCVRLGNSPKSFQEKGNRKLKRKNITKKRKGPITERKEDKTNKDEPSTPCTPNDEKEQPKTTPRM